MQFGLARYSINQNWGWGLLNYELCSERLNGYTKDQADYFHEVTPVAHLIESDSTFSIITAIVSLTKIPGKYCAFMRQWKGQIPFHSEFPWCEVWVSFLGRLTTACVMAWGARWKRGFFSLTPLDNCSCLLILPVFQLRMSMAACALIFIL